jgi:hypothetical protein
MKRSRMFQPWTRAVKDNQNKRASSTTNSCREEARRRRASTGVTREPPGSSREAYPGKDTDQGAQHPLAPPSCTHACNPQRWEAEQHLCCPLIEGCEPSRGVPRDESGRDKRVGPTPDQMLAADPWNDGSRGRQKWVGSSSFPRRCIQYRRGGWFAAEMR